MNSIFKKIEGKSCSCATGKKCSSCKKQKAIKPVVYIEEPRRLPTSIVISRVTTRKQQQKEENKAKQIIKLHTEEKKKVEKLKKLYSEEEKRILKQRNSNEKKLKKEEQPPPAAKRRLPSLRSWYRRRKALIRLEHDRRKEEKDKEKLNENEALHALEEQTKAGWKKAQRKVKEREATAKPLAHSKYASVKEASKTNKTLTYRFVNFCNKLCCQCYCYFSIIVILGFLFIYFL